MMHWYDDSYVIGLIFTFTVYPTVACILIFRPHWLRPFFGNLITPARGKVAGGIALLAFVGALAKIADHFIRGTHP